MRSAEYLVSVVEAERSILTAGALCGGGIAWWRGGSWSRLVGCSVSVGSVGLVWIGLVPFSLV